MLTYLSKKQVLDSKQNAALEKACKKVNLNKDDVDLLIFDKMLFSYIFVLAVSNKKLYLYDSEHKKTVHEFDIKDFENISVQKKVDLNLYLKGNRFFNLTSVVGVKPKVMNQVRELNSEINRLK